MPKSLSRSLGLTPAIAVVAGSVLGTGVFLKSATMAQDAGTPVLVMLAWITAGIASLAGALVYAELGAKFPEAGGEYVFLREAFGKLSAFLFGWSRVVIASPAAIAAYAVGSASFLAGVWIQNTHVTRTIVAISLIVLFTILNCFSVAFAGRSQIAITSLKVMTILALSLGAFLSGGTAATPVLSTTSSWPGPAAFGSAVIAALWAYDGWNNLPMLAGEMKNPIRNVPLSLGIGMLFVTVLYLLVNASFFYVLPFSEVINANSHTHRTALPIATKAAATFLGQGSVRLLALAFVLSAIGAMNGQILAGARVPYAMAKDGIFFRGFEVLSESAAVPVRAVLAQSALACLYALSGSFDQLTDSVVFASWIFYGASTVALFRFRSSKKLGESSFQTPLYPVLPILFLFVSTLLVVLSFLSSPTPSFIGILFLALGLPVYSYFIKHKK